MPTLRRILKYTSAVVFGLLVVAWVVSLIVRLGVFQPIGKVQVSCGIGHGTCSFGVKDFDPDFLVGWSSYPAVPSMGILYVLGSASYFTSFPDGEWTYAANIPIPLLLTAVLPLAIGPLISFRFRLSHYLAYTALVAAELAYYLRRQE
jgi:hypothetical protein